MNTAIFDLDGLLAQAPYGDPRVKTELNDPEFWHAHWTSTPEAHEEMCELAATLEKAGYQVIILTGRPEKYREDTRDWLRQHGLYVVPEAFRLWDTRLQLVMRPENACSTAAAWKLWQIEEWMAQGMSVRFIVEDHKPSADVLRRAAPVLLYERQRD